MSLSTWLIETAQYYVELFEKIKEIIISNLVTETVKLNPLYIFKPQRIYSFALIQESVKQYKYSYALI